MRKLLFYGARWFELGAGVARRAPLAEGAQDRGSALALLRRLAAEPENMRQMRALLGASAEEGVVRRLDDAAVTDRLATLLLAGRAALVELPAPAIPARGGEDIEEEPVAPSSARAPLKPLTWIEIKLIGEDGKPIPGEEYRVDLPDGTARQGRLDAQGFVRIDQIDPGTCVVTFPALDEESWTRIG